MTDILDNVSTGLVVLGIIGGVLFLALVEKMRSKFVTKDDLAAAEGRIAQAVLSGVRGDLQTVKNDIAAWEVYSDEKLATRIEVDGFGARVTNVEHMFTAVQQMAVDAKDIAKDSQKELRHLREELARSNTLADQNGKHMQTIVITLEKMQTEMEIRREIAAGRKLKNGENHG